MSLSTDLCASRPSAAAPVVLVMGGARCIGRALALGFAVRGWDVVVHYQGARDEADEVVAAIVARGRRALALHADLAREADVEALVPACTSKLGRPRCVINNATPFDEDTVHDVGYPRLLRQMAVNVGAPLVLARALYDATPAAAGEDETQRAVVINLLDQKPGNVNPDCLSDTLSKAALDNATVALARALAPRVRVVGLAPGLTTLRPAMRTPAGCDAAHRAMRLRRASRPQDLLDAALYLATAAGVTGTTLVVDGGQHLVPSPRDGVLLIDR